jgi:diaminopimelate epimerase
VIDNNGWVHLKMIDIHEVSYQNDAIILNTGSPHYIKPVLGLSNYDVFAEGKKIRYNESQ